MMRIACVSTSKVPSLTANSMQLMKVCQALVELGHQVRLWLPGDDPGLDWATLAERYGVRQRFEITWLGELGLLRRYDFCLRAVLAGRSWGADLFYVWPLQAAAMASLIGGPTVLELHDRPPGRSGPLLFRLFMWGSGSRRLLPTTEALRTHLEREYDLRLELPFAIVSPNAVEGERYADLPSPSEARRELGLADRFTAGYTGHLYQGRGTALMFELARRNADVAFVWAGGQPDAVEFWRREAELRAVGNLELLGFVPNARLPLVQAASDVLLMPYGRRIGVSSGVDSGAFASPMKAFEYLAAGRAILSSDLPVLREVLDESRAVLLPPEDVDAWVEALGRLKDDEGERTRLSQEARRRGLASTWKARTERALGGAGLRRRDG